MTKTVADFGMIGDRRTGALIDRAGSIVWWCAPRFDSGAVFASLLGDDGNGVWSLAPEHGTSTTRTYRGETLIYQTTFELADGSARVTDFMPVAADHPTIVRIAEGLTGAVDVRMVLTPRMQYGRLRPASRAESCEWVARAGSDGLVLRADSALVDDAGSCRARVVLRPGRRERFTLQWFPAHESPPPACDADAELQRATAWWEAWSSGLMYAGPWRDMVVRSAITLEAMTDRRTGGIVAALTTSLPEEIGGSKNWDYRYCWLRDASFTAASLLRLGKTQEAESFRDWFFRAYAGDPAQLRIMYGIAGEALGPSSSCFGSAAFATPARCASGMERTTSSSSVRSPMCCTFSRGLPVRA